MGKIPTQLAALMQTNINVQALTVKAVLKEDPSLIYHAAMLDPHTAAELDLDQIWGLVDDLIGAHGEWIPRPLRTNSREIRPAAARAILIVTVLDRGLNPKTETDLAADYADYRYNTL
jgi:Family 4 glycosyl hydrolase C-terminal domain